MSQRQERLADQLQRDLAELVRQELRDPRIGMVTVSAVKVSRDLGYADVYVTLLQPQLQKDTEARQLSVARLNAAAGFLRTALGKTLSLRVVPRLRFHYDEVLANAQHLASLIEQAVQDDAAE